MDYKIIGSDIQHLLINLNPGEKVYLNPGYLIWKDSTVKLNVKVKGGILSGMARLYRGSSFFLLEAEGPGFVDLTSRFFGKIIDIDLNNSTIFVDHEGFVAAQNDVDYDFSITRFGFGVFGKQGLIFAKFSGTGKLFISAPGDIIMVQLNGNRTIEIEAGHVLAYEPGVKLSITRVRGFRTMLFGKEGLFFVRASGVGRVWIKLYTIKELLKKLVPEAYLY
ncbi:MAG: TIGR00266 family protein [Nanopusillaceae archaeon]